MPHDHGIGERFVARLSTAALVVVSVLVPSMTAGAQEPTAKPDSAESRADLLPWTGSMTTSYDRTWLGTGGSYRTHQTGSATYTRLQAAPHSVDPDGWGSYFADVVAKSTQRVDSTCGLPGGLLKAQTASWDYTGDSRNSQEAAGGGSGFINGNVLSMQADDAGGVHLLLHYASVSVLTNYHCPNTPVPTARNGYGAFSFHPGLMTSHATLPLVDNDPSPDHLVGTTTFQPDDIPGSSINYENYEFTVTYDLRRMAVDGDSDGDGVPNLSDNCATTPNAGQSDGDGDGAGDACDNCPAVVNADQGDLDGDLSGDLCDDDIDGDGLENDAEVETDPYDSDTDGDQVLDGADRCPLEPGEVVFQGCPELDECEDPQEETADVKTVTPLPGPDVHWYTTTLRVGWCAPDDRDPYVTSLDVDRHVEGGPVPFLISQFGWNGGQETDVSYTPDPVVGHQSATAEFSYTACFDVTKLLDKAGVKKAVTDQAKRVLKKPLRVAIKKILRKAGATKVGPRSRPDIARELTRRLDHLWRKGQIKTWLRDHLHVPEKIGKIAEKYGKAGLDDWQKFVKNEGSTAIRNGRYDGYVASVAADKILNDVIDWLFRPVNVCGFAAAEDSFLRTHIGLFSVDVSSSGVAISQDDFYLHPLMSVR